MLENPRTMNVKTEPKRGAVCCSLNDRSVDLPGRSPREMAMNVIDYAAVIEAERVVVNAYGLGQLLYDELVSLRPEHLLVVRAQ